MPRVAVLCLWALFLFAANSEETETSGSYFDETASVLDGAQHNSDERATALGEVATMAEATGSWFPVEADVTGNGIVFPTCPAGKCNQDQDLLAGTPDVLPLQQIQANGCVCCPAGTYPRRVHLEGPVEMVSSYGSSASETTRKWTVPGHANCQSSKWSTEEATSAEITVVPSYIVEDGSNTVSGASQDDDMWPTTAIKAGVEEQGLYYRPATEAGRKFYWAQCMYWKISQCTAPTDITVDGVTTSQRSCAAARHVVLSKITSTSKSNPGLWANSHPNDGTKSWTWEEFKADSAVPEALKQPSPCGIAARIA